MKFDLIISNPPYNNNLDLKILKEVYPLGDRICFIHPAGWLYDNVNNPKSIRTQTKDVVRDSFQSAKCFNGNELFGIGLNTDISITFLDKTKASTDINDIDIHGQSDIYKSIKKKILSYCRVYGSLSINTLCRTEQNHRDVNKWEVITPKLAGSISDTSTIYQSKDFNKIISDTPRTDVIGKDLDGWRIHQFETKDEAYNFYTYLKLKITRFCMSINKWSFSIEVSSIPYLPTYTKQWTNESVAEEIGLTKEELEWCINWIPNYYPEEKSYS